MSLNEWMKSGRYLPSWLRDFHAQKDVFKWLWSRVDRKSDFGGMSWVSAHIFTIDFFLWFMALHGWTLQRSKASCAGEFRDIHESVDGYREEMAQAFAKMLDDRRAARPTSPTDGEKE